MNNIGAVTFIYDVVNDICYIQESNQSFRELTIKGATKHNGEVNGT